MKRYGYFMSLSQVRGIVSSNDTIEDAEGNLIIDLLNFFRTVSNLRFSVLFHHGPNSEKQYLNSRAQLAISYEPNDVNQSIIDYHKRKIRRPILCHLK